MIANYYLIFVSLVFLMSASKCRCSCDIFLLGECVRPSAAPVASNLNESNSKSSFCIQTRKHVNCINKKLQECSQMNEYASAMETVKLNLKMEISLAKAKGCRHLTDKIKLPPGAVTHYMNFLQTNKQTMKRSKTTTSVRSKNTLTKCEHTLTDPICHQLDPILKKNLLLNETVHESDSMLFTTKPQGYYEDLGCSSVGKYIKCFSMDTASCQSVLNRLEKVNKKCLMQKSKAKFSSPISNASLLGVFNDLSDRLIFVFIIFAINLFECY